MRIYPVVLQFSGLHLEIVPGGGGGGKTIYCVHKHTLPRGVWEHATTENFARNSPSTPKSSHFTGVIW